MYFIFIIANYFSIKWRRFRRSLYI